MIYEKEFLDLFLSRFDMARLLDFLIYSSFRICYSFLSESAEFSLCPIVFLTIISYL